MIQRGLLRGAVRGGPAICTPVSTLRCALLITDPSKRASSFVTRTRACARVMGSYRSDYNDVFASADIGPVRSTPAA